LPSSLSGYVQLSIINFLNLAVPLFLAISGYFIGKKNLKNIKECNGFWKKQIPTVYVPCLVFSIPWFLVSSISNPMNWSGTILKVLNLFLCGYSVYYFIALIIQCYLLAPLLIKHNNLRTLVIVMVISILSMLIIEVVRYEYGRELPLIVRGAFPPLLIFFYLGIFFSKHNRDYSICYPMLLIIGGLILGILQMEYLYNRYGIVATGQKTFLYLFDTGCILLCLSKKIENLYIDSWLNRLFLRIGEISFGIYFTHVYLIWIIERWVPQLKDNWFILWFATVCITILVIQLIKRVAPSLSLKYLGYR